MDGYLVALPNERGALQLALFTRKSAAQTYLEVLQAGDPTSIDVRIKRFDEVSILLDAVERLKPEVGLVLWNPQFPDDGCEATSLAVLRGRLMESATAVSGPHDTVTPWGG